MDDSKINSDIFLECNWGDIASTLSESYDYQRADIISAQLGKSESPEKKRVCILLQKVFSMRLKPESINAPFEPLFINYETQKRTAIIDDFSNNELEFLYEILVHIEDPWSEARLNDILWLCHKPRNPDFARVAISSYISSDISSLKWIQEQEKEWERAARLCLQLREIDQLSVIISRVVSEIRNDSDDSKFMALRLAKFLLKLKIASEHYQHIAEILTTNAVSLKQEKDFYSSRAYYELAEKMYDIVGDKELWVKCLVNCAEVYELDGDERNIDSHMGANSSYERALQAYRKVPKKYRIEYSIDEILKRLQQKLTISGQETIDNMGTFALPPIDIKDIAEKAISHVSGKPDPQLALLYFVGVNQISEYSKLESDAKEMLSQFSFRSLIGSTQMSNDGRVVAKSPSIPLNSNASDNALAVYNQMLSNFNLGLQFTCDAAILPSLNRIVQEFRITRDFLEAVCFHSPIVPSDRVKLVASALWFGFEYEFGIAIHLICPQVEHMIRVKLKNNGESTSTVDPNGIETENGLSSLMDNPKIDEIFGKDLAFELRAVFTESLGSNLRNEAAHGLLSDDSTNSYAAIYAWWLSLRLVLHAMVK